MASGNWRATCDHLEPGVNAPPRRCGRIAVARVWVDRVVGTVAMVREGTAFRAELGPLYACSTHTAEDDVVRAAAI
jgi:hypothetical protein